MSPSPKLSHSKKSISPNSSDKSIPTIASEKGDDLSDNTNEEGPGDPEDWNELFQAILAKDSCKKNKTNKTKPFTKKPFDFFFFFFFFLVYSKSHSEVETSFTNSIALFTVCSSSNLLGKVKLYNNKSTKNKNFSLLFSFPQNHLIGDRFTSVSSIHSTN